MKAISYIGIFMLSAITCISATAQITSLESLDNTKSYTIKRLPGDSGNQRILYADGTQVNTAATATGTDIENWAVYKSAETGSRYIYNLGSQKFLVNNVNGCMLDGTASPYDFIETLQAGAWLLMNNYMLTGLSSENNGILFSKDEDFSTADITFEFTETSRELTSEELSRIKELVAATESDIRAGILSEMKTLIDKAKLTEGLGKSDFAGNYQYEELEAAYENPAEYTNAEREELINITEASVYPQEGTYYRILNKARPNNGSMNNTLTITDYISSNNLGARNITDWTPGIALNNVLDNLSLFNVFKTDDGDSYILYSPGAKIYAGGEESNGAHIPLLQDKSEAAPYNLIYEGDLLFRFQSSNNTDFYITANGESNCVSYNKLEDAELWYFQKIESVDINIDSNGYSTICLPCAVILPSEIDAYIGVSQDNNSLRVEKLEDYTGNKILPAYTPVILKLAEGTETYRFTCPIVYDAPQTEFTNLLQGTTLRSELEDGSYILKQGNDGIGFYLVNPDETRINCNRVYLPQSAIYQSSVFLLDFYGETTSISSERVVDDKSAEKIYYDLNGRRVMNPQKGIYITNDGEKVIVK